MNGGLLFLCNDDFSLQKGSKGDILCHSISGYSLILFYSTHCSHCQTLIPIFKQLPGTVVGCQFGMVNVSTNKAIIEMARRSVTPITYVPLIILYITGKPFMIYKGPYDIQEIKRFVVEVAGNIQKKQTFSKDKIREEPKSSIPAYTIGKPISGTEKGVCYLEFDNAYTKDNKG